MEKSYYISYIIYHISYIISRSLSISGKRNVSLPPLSIKICKTWFHLVPTMLMICFVVPNMFWHLFVFPYRKKHKKVENIETHITFFNHIEMEWWSPIDTFRGVAQPPTTDESPVRTIAERLRWARYARSHAARQAGHDTKGLHRQALICLYFCYSIYNIYILIIIYICIHIFISLSFILKCMYILFIYIYN